MKMVAMAKCYVHRKEQGEWILDIIHIFFPKAEHS